MVNSSNEHIQIHVRAYTHKLMKRTLTHDFLVARYELWTAKISTHTHTNCRTHAHRIAEWKKVEKFMSNSIFIVLTTALVLLSVAYVCALRIRLYASIRTPLRTECETIGQIAWKGFDFKKKKRWCDIDTHNNQPNNQFNVQFLITLRISFEIIFFFAFGSRYMEMCVFTFFYIFWNHLYIGCAFCFKRFEVRRKQFSMLGPVWHTFYGQIVFNRIINKYKRHLSHLPFVRLCW